MTKVVHACLGHAKEAGRPLAKSLHDVGDWRRRYDDLEQDLDAVVRPRRGTQPAAERTVKTVGQCDPFDLEVHWALPPTGAETLADGLGPLTPYLNREHDTELRAMLRGAAGGGPSVFAVLVGDSCTGKTRALYEAVSEVVANWPLLRPADADELLDLLQKGRFRAGTVLWLNETQRYLDSLLGERVASLLRSTLAATDGAVAVGALWFRPYLEKLTATGNSPDLHAAARALLDGPRTRRITVPKRLDSHEQQELAALAGSDKRLAAALAASGPDGDVIQHLTGGPGLLYAYIHDELFTPVERALITAALDTRRLGQRTRTLNERFATAADKLGSDKPAIQLAGYMRWQAWLMIGRRTGRPALTCCALICACHIGLTRARMLP